ncbi:hypothetical protein FACS189429_2300 [Bacteroidia bacterium]|nr:hypothetical protein FACS189429_2300 [Bacteroidia bacterium]GHV44986.1 hypothetical protein FACS1894180_7010 [Bacteroidia bacterium]
MRKVFVLMFLAMILVTKTTVCAQSDSVGNRTVPLMVAEICKMVELSEYQKEMLSNLYAVYIQQMDSAVYEVTDVNESSALIYNVKKQWNEELMTLLSDTQKIEYTRNSARSEVWEKAAAKVKSLRKNPKYSEEELAEFQQQIFDYLMLEKIAYACDRYNIERQKENIAQLKKLEPQSLKEANTLQKAKHQGVVYQNGYRW